VRLHWRPLTPNSASASLKGSRWASCAIRWCVWRSGSPSARARRPIGSWRLFFRSPPLVAAGFEHSVANMYFVPLGLMIRAGAPPAFWAAIGRNAADCSSTRPLGTCVTRNSGSFFPSQILLDSVDSVSLLATPSGGLLTTPAGVVSSRSVRQTEGKEAPDDPLPLTEQSAQTLPPTVLGVKKPPREG
jgi:hypothetical protein